MFDNLSAPVFYDAVKLLVNGKTLQPDLGFLKYADLESNPKNIRKSDDIIMGQFSGITNGGNIPEMIPYIRSVQRWHQLNVSPSLIRNFAHSKNITLPELFTAVYGYVITRFNGRSSAPFTDVINGRENGFLDHSIGMFAKAIPMRFDCSKPDVDSFIETSVNEIRMIMSNHYCSFRSLLTEFTDILEASFNIIINGADVKQFDVDIEYEGGVNPLEFLLYLPQDDSKFIIGCKRQEKHTPELITQMIAEFEFVLSKITTASKMSELSSPERT